MKFFRSLRLIPREYRARGVVVIVSSVLRALFDLVGLAALVAILLLIVSPDGIAGNKWLSEAYRAFGFSSEKTFTWVMCASIVLIIAAKSVLNLVILRFRNNYLMSLYRHYSRAMLDSYYRRGLLFIKSKNSAKLAYEVNFVSMGYVQGVLMNMASMIGDSLLVVMMFTAIIIYNPAAALMVFALFAPLVFVYVQSVRGRLQNYGKQENEIRRKQSRIVQETFRGYPEIEINNAFPYMEEQFDEGLKEISRFRRIIQTVQATPSIIIETGFALALVALVILRVDAILLGIFGVVALRMLPSFRNLINSWIAIRNNRYTEEIVAQGIGTEETLPAPATAGQRMAFRDKITVDNVSFSFGDGAPRVIDGFSLEIRKGERIGVKGVSGGGKTTLFNLLLGLYPPTSGEIRIDGTAISGENRRNWQNIVGYVPQEVFVMDSSIAENVALGAPTDRRRVARALEAARLGEFAAALPQGIDTQIGEGGSRLSGGQKQRLGIARALYKEAEVLFFDEATSALDGKTEREINDAIRELSETRAEITIIIIAHRESSLAFCDRIIEIGS